MSSTDPLAKIDVLMNIIEVMKTRIARLAKTLDECGASKGDLYTLYQLMLKLEDGLVELRRLVYEECGGSAAAGPRHGHGQR